MKKTLAAALSAALVVGATATTFAAANPFSDLPADHWAYDAVTQLAEDGVLEGYGDTTFRGDRNITRYEMAQMVAKMMANQNVDGADKALLDRLAAEFSEELNSLGVRVANLERNADMVKWTGEMRYQYWSERTEVSKGHKDKTNVNNLRLRFNPEMEVNDHWKIKARMQADIRTDKDSGGNGTRDKMKLVYTYADGHYGKWNFAFGRMPLWSDADEGLTVDDYFSGGQIIYGSKLKAKLEAGRWNMNNSWELYNNSDGIISSGLSKDSAANYQGIELNYHVGKWNLGGSFRHFNSAGLKNAVSENGRVYSRDGKADDANIWSVGTRYTFDRNFSIMGAFAQNTEADNLKTSHNVEVNYKGAQKANPRTWGLYAAYRYMSPFVSLTPTYDIAGLAYNKKGIDVGFKYTPFKNVVTTLAYFNGKKLDTHRDAETLFGYVRVYF